MTKRKIISILLAAMMLTALSGCGGDSTAEKGSDESSRVSRRDRNDDDDSKDGKDDSRVDSKDDDSSRGDDADAESSSDDSGNDKADSESSKDSADDDRGSSGGRDESSSDSSKAPENSTSNTGGGSGVTATQSDYDAAQNVLKKFMDAMQSGDRDGMLQYSDLGKYFEMYQKLYTLFDYDEEDSEEMLDELFFYMFDDMAIESYTIGAGERHDELVTEYQLYLAEAREEMDEWDEDEADAEEYLLISEIMDMYPTIEKVYAFEVTATVDGDADTEYLLVAYEDGAWKVDLIFISETVGYPDEFDVH